MSDEKDRLGNKLRDVEAAREDQWAAKHDAELMKRMREKLEKSMECPECKRIMVARRVGDLAVLACPSGEGAWVSGPDFEKLVKSRG